MQIIQSSAEFVKWRTNKTDTIGFVPTLGALHDGHLSLVQSSKKICHLTVVSIFLNPAQFAPEEDLNSYPNTLDKDINSLTNCKVDVLFLPTREEMYDRVPNVNIPSSDLFNKLEGCSRPHFFYGVTTIVAKLFNVIKPTHTFFGEKDAQQLRIIQEMIVNMKYSIECVSCMTIRHKNGLALSSRNQYLTDEEQKKASIIFQGLTKVRGALEQGQKNPVLAKKIFTELIQEVPGITIDYISIACSKTLEEVEKIVDKKLLVSTAVFFKGVRLIDNFTYSSSST